MGVAKTDRSMRMRLAGGKVRSRLWHEVGLAMLGFHNVGCSTECFVRALLFPKTRKEKDPVWSTTRAEWHLLPRVQDIYLSGYQVSPSSILFPASHFLLPVVFRSVREINIINAE